MSVFELISNGYYYFRSDLQRRGEYERARFTQVKASFRRLKDIFENRRCRDYKPHLSLDTRNKIIEEQDPRPFFEELFAKVISPKDRITLLAAYEHTARNMFGYLRNSGEHYRSHIEFVTKGLLFLFPGRDLGVETYLMAIHHDTIEDTNSDKDEVRKEIQQISGERVLKGVEALTKIEKGEVEAESPEDRDSRSIHKLLDAAITNPSIILTKLADRWHNLLTQKGVTDKVDKKTGIVVKTAQERIDDNIAQTERVFIPVARFFNLTRAYISMMNLCFRFGGANGDRFVNLEKLFPKYLKSDHFLQTGLLFDEDYENQLSNIVSDVTTKAMLNSRFFDTVMSQVSLLAREPLLDVRIWQPSLLDIANRHDLLSTKRDKGITWEEIAIPTVEIGIPGSISELIPYFEAKREVVCPEFGDIDRHPVRFADVEEVEITDVFLNGVKVNLVLYDKLNVGWRKRSLDELCDVKPKIRDIYHTAQMQQDLSQMWQYLGPDDLATVDEFFSTISNSNMKRVFALDLRKGRGDLRVAIILVPEKACVGDVIARSVSLADVESITSYVVVPKGESLSFKVADIEWSQQLSRAVTGDSIVLFQNGPEIENPQAEELQHFTTAKALHVHRKRLKKLYSNDQSSKQEQCEPLHDYGWSVLKKELTRRSKIPFLADRHDFFDRFAGTISQEAYWNMLELCALSTDRADLNNIVKILLPYVEKRRLYSK